MHKSLTVKPFYDKRRNSANEDKHKYSICGETDKLKNDIMDNIVDQPHMLDYKIYPEDMNGKINHSLLNNYH